MKPDNVPAISQQQAAEAAKIAIQGKPSNAKKLRVVPPAFRKIKVDKYRKPKASRELSVTQKFKKVLEDSSEKALLEKPNKDGKKQQENPVVIKEIGNNAAKTLLSPKLEDKKSLNAKKEKDDKNLFQKIIDVAKIKKKEELKKEEKISQLTKVYTVKRNDSLSTIFDNLGYGSTLARKVAISLVRNANFKVTNLRVGQKLIFTERQVNGEKKLVKFQIPKGIKTITLNIDDKTEYKVTKKTKKTKSEYFFKKGSIKSNISNLGARLKLPSKVTNKVIKIISNKINPSTDIKKGDILEVLYERIYDEKGKLLNSGNTIYIGLQRGYYKTEAFRFSKTGDSDDAEYYDLSSNAFKKSISRRPVAGKYRISSSFGYRKHPILKRKMLHTGVDFAAKRGTPIVAAGSGTIVKLGRYGGYGKYIKIKHDAVWQTAYAHLNAYKKGLRRGSRVKKGQVIGYVGNTGRSTGPHLHFEVIKYGRPVNPMKAKLPTSGRLYGKDYKNFLKAKEKIRKILNKEKAILFEKNAPIPQEKPKRKK